MIYTPSAPVNANHYADLPSDTQTWVVRDLLPSGGLLNIFGPPKSGKSFAAMQLAYDIAGVSHEWLGFPIHQHGPILYLQLDTPRSLWKARLHDLRETTGLDGSNVFIADREIAPFPFDILQPERGGRWLYDACQQIKPIAVFIDVLRELSRAEENDSGEMMSVINALVATVAPAACVLISHSKKDNMNIPASERDQLMHDNRGSSYVAGRMDGVIKVTKKTLVYQSRTCEEGRLPIERDPVTHLWRVKQSEFDAQVGTILADPQYTSILGRAKALADLSGRPIESCRNALRARVKEPYAHLKTEDKA